MKQSTIRFCITVSFLLLTVPRFYPQSLTLYRPGAGTAILARHDIDGTVIPPSSPGTSGGSSSSAEDAAIEAAKASAYNEASRKEDEAEKELSEAEAAVQGVADITTVSYKEEMQKAEAKLKAAEQLLATASNTAEIAKARGILAQAKEEQKRLLQKVGDPVILATGEFTDSVTDLIISANTLQFPVTRSYRSGNTITGSMGYGWITSLDQRIIPGIPPAAEETARDVREYLAELEAEAAALENTFTATYGAKDPATARQQLQAKRAKASAALTLANQAVSNAETAYTTFRNLGNYASSATMDKAKSRQATYQAMVNHYNQALSSIDADTAAITARQARITEVRAQYRDYLEYQLSPTVFPGTPEYFYENGVTKATLITSDGTPVLFKSAGNGYWVPESGGESGVWYKQLQIMTDGTWVLTLRNGTVKTFTASGFFTKEEDRNGNAVSVTYDGDTGQIRTISTSTGEQFAVTCNQQGFITAITSNSDDTYRIAYAYNGSCLSSFSDPDDYTTRYSYDSHHTLSEIRKADGTAITYTLQYDDDGASRVTATTNEKGISESFSYSPETHTAWHSDHDGNHTRYTFDDQGRTIQTENAAEGRCTNQWSEDGRLVSENRNGTTTRFQYNSQGDLERVFYPDGTRESWVWNAAGDLTAYQDRQGNTETYDRDVRGNLLHCMKNGVPAYRCTYDRYGRILSREEYTGTPRTTTYTWDSRGNLAFSTVQGITLRYRYDTRNRLIAIYAGEEAIEQRSYTNRSVTIEKENGLKTTIRYNDRKDTASIEQTDTVTGETRKTCYTYDSQHHPLLETLNGVPVAACRYNGEGNPVARIRFGSESSVVTCWSWKGNTQEQVQVFSVTGPENAAVYTHPDTWQTVSLEYLKQQAEKRHDFFQFGVTAQVASEPLPAAEDHSVKTYDNRGRLIRKCVVSEAAGSPVEYREDYQYTNGGRTITVTRGGQYAAVYQLNAFGEITAATDGEGNTTTYRVTPQGLRKSVTLPMGNTMSFSYDCLGNVTQLIQPDGSTVTFQYNALGTLLCTTDGTGTPHYPEVSVANEPADSLRDTTGLTYDRNGNLIDAVSGTNHLTFTWNQAGLLTQQKDVQRGITTSWTYDKAGRPETAITRQQGKEISALHYQWDANGNLISLRDTAQNLSVTCAYDVMNREVEKRYGNGTVCRTRYDAAGRKTALWTTSSQGDIIAAEAMVYDPDTGRKAASFTREGMLILYSYDQQGHLCRIQKTATPEEVLSAKARIQVIPAATVKALRSAISQAHPSLGSRIPSTVALVTETYTFDERGNRILRETPAGTTQYSYDDRDRLTAVRQVEKGTVETFVWDDRGNLTEKRASGRTDRYHYDRKNRLVQVEITTGSGKATQTQCITYDYDALGRRYSTTTNGTTVLSVYNGVSFAVTAELFDLPDTPQYRYRWSEDTGKETGSRTRLFINGAPAAERRGTATAYLAEDSTGSVVLETDQYGRITASRSYDVFGTTISSEILQYR